MTPEERSEYNKNYYESNKEKLKAKRAERILIQNRIKKLTAEQVEAKRAEESKAKVAEESKATEELKAKVEAKNIRPTSYMDMLPQDIIDKIYEINIVAEVNEWKKKMTKTFNLINMVPDMEGYYTFVKDREQHRRVGAFSYEYSLKYHTYGWWVMRNFREQKTITMLFKSKKAKDDYYAAKTKAREKRREKARLKRQAKN